MTTRATRLNKQTRLNLSTMISSLAGTDVDDPTIAARLGISVSQVRSIRYEYHIAAGEQRWRGGNRRVAPR